MRVKFTAVAQFLFLLSVLALPARLYAGKELLFKTLAGHTEDVWTVAFSSDGKYLASGGKDASIRVWKADTFEPLKTLSKHSKPVTCVSFAPDGGYLASAGMDNAVFIWDTASYEPAVSLLAHTSPVFSVAFSHNGGLFASGGFDNTVRVWQNRSFKPVRTLQAAKGIVTVAFSADDSMLAAGGKEGVISVWSVKDYRQIKVLNAHKDYIWCVNFSPDGKYLVSTGKDKVTNVWALPDLSLVKTLAGHSGSVLSAGFSPDGKYLATAGEDKIIKLWKVADFSEASTLTGHESNVDSLAFSPDGRYIASAGEDKTVRIWLTPWEAETRAAKRRDELSLADYQSSFQAGIKLAGKGMLKFRSNSKAYQKFKEAAGYRDTEEVRQKLAETSKALRDGMIHFGFIAFALVGFSALAFVFVYRRKKRLYLQEELPSQVIELSAAGKYDEAMALFAKFKSVGGDLARIPADAMYELFSKKDKLAVLVLEKVPAGYFVAFAKKLLAQGDADLAWRAFDSYKATAASAELIPAVFSEDETIKLYSGAQKWEALAKESLSAAKLIQAAGELAASGKQDIALKLVGSEGFLAKEGAASVENLEVLAGIYEAAGQPDAFKAVLKAGKYPKELYACAALVFHKLKKEQEVIDILGLSAATYLGGLAAADYQLLVAAYKTLGRLEELDPASVPAEYLSDIAESLMEKGKNQEALTVLTKRPQADWSDRDYHLCMQLYTRLDMYELAEAMAEKMFKLKPVNEAPEFYYDFAFYCEKAGKLDKALEIYKEFLTKGVTFRDVVIRYPALRDKLTQQNAKPAQPAPAAAPAVAAQPVPAAEPEPREAPSAVAVAAAPPPKLSKLDEDARLIAALKGGKLELVKEIGRGGMGIVYQVFDKSLNRKVALKRMREELYISRKEAGKFLNEARTVAQLNHPNIVIVYEILEQDDMLNILFEYIDGNSLEQMLETAPNGIPLNEAVRIIEQICNGLSYAHNHNIIHRDLKPSNIMMAHDGLVKITDFGIARMAKDTILRLTGASTGTLAYMAPEQELGSFDARSDIYSLGVIIYELLTGELPFRGPNFYLQKEKMAFRSVVDLVPELPKEMDEIINTCLSADKEKRYSSVDELLRDIVGKI